MINNGNNDLGSKIDKSFLRTPDTWSLIIFDSVLIRNLTIPAGGNKSTLIEYHVKSKLLLFPVIQIMTTEKIWGYFSTQVTEYTNTGCRINIHNFENKERIVDVACIILR